MAALVPIIAAALIIYAAIDIYRNAEHDPRKSKRKNDEESYEDEYYDDESYDDEEDWD